jgi:hypothetical protein
VRSRKNFANLVNFQSATVLAWSIPEMIRLEYLAILLALAIIFIWGMLVLVIVGYL